MTPQIKGNNDKKYQEYKKLNFIDNRLNDGWVVFKKKEKYYFMKNKEIFKNKNMDISKIIHSDDSIEL